MLGLHKQFTNNGFEGTIIRNKKGVYKVGHRSADLQKYKDFFDDEYKIVGAHEGVGKAKGAVTWICVTEAGEEFDVVPKGSMEKRQEWWRDREKYFGEMLTVKYQNLTADRKVPYLPSGLAIRNYE
jgi:DNA ligase-1